MAEISQETAREMLAALNWTDAALSAAYRSPNDARILSGLPASVISAWRQTRAAIYRAEKKARDE